MEVDKKLRAAVSYQKAEDFDRARNIYLDILLNVENADALNNLAILTLNSSDGANVHSLFYRCLQVSEKQHFINYTSIQNKLGEVTSQFMKLLDSLPQTKKNSLCQRIIINIATGHYK